MLPRFVGGFNRGDARAKEVTANCSTSPTRALRRDTGHRPRLAARCRPAPLAPQVKAPTLLIHGAADPLMPLAAAEALAALIPGARVEAMASPLRPRPVYLVSGRFRGADSSFLND
jgi:pimeloyl-[acyl-carrier protein] methyl ester esterase